MTGCGDSSCWLGEQLDNTFQQPVRLLVQRLLGQIGNGMRHIEKTVFRNPPGFRHLLPGNPERLGYNGDRWYAGFFQQYPVEHTARTAGPSVADAGDDNVRLVFEIVYSGV